MKSNVLKLSLIVFTLFMFVGCTATPNIPVHSELNQEEFDDKHSDLVDNNEQEQKEIYEIKGVSNRLSSNAWARLQSWRENIVELARLEPELIIINGSTSEKLVALTFDDGPDSRVTPMVISILNEYNVKGSFFFTGINMKALPNIVKRAHSDGHLVLPHSYNHANFTDKTYDFIYGDFQKTNDIIESIIGYVPRLMRPPYGVVNERVIQVAKAHNQNLVIWSTDTLDWSQREKDNIVRNVLDNVRPGEIVLMHSIGSNMSTVEALPEIIEGLLAKGFRIVTLYELLGFQ